MLDQELVQEKAVPVQEKQQESPRFVMVYVDKEKNKNYISNFAAVYFGFIEYNEVSDGLFEVSKQILDNIIELGYKIEYKILASIKRKEVNMIDESDNDKNKNEQINKSFNIKKNISEKEYYEELKRLLNQNNEKTDFDSVKAMK